MADAVLEAILVVGPFQIGVIEELLAEMAAGHGTT